MDEDELRFVCKLCNKKYPCGKSLGGHMRSHVVSVNGNANVNGNAATGSELNFGSGGAVAKQGKLAELAGYGLRENPRRSWRAAADSNDERSCKQCGKAFHSMKALCGHMASHTERDRGAGSSKDDQLWTGENLRAVTESCSESEAEEERVATRRSQRCKKVIDESSPLNGSSSVVSEVDEQDQEDVAMCLMMLSMDSNNGNKFTRVNLLTESSDNNSVVVETKSSSTLPDENPPTTLKIERTEDSDSAYFLEECSKEDESDVSFDKCKKPINLKLITSFRAPSGKEKGYYYDEDDMTSIFAGIESRKRKYVSKNRPEPNPVKKTRYECFNCKKTFKSYQALGGHRPCHKKANAFYDESDENSLDESAEYQAANNGKVSDPTGKAPSSKSKNGKAHVCPFCNRTFKNGQALGGHKRSHFVGANAERNNRSLRGKPDAPDLLDLNLPAPEEE
ncbi:zinc finger protein ZAT9-like [Andrographis paniculata]|uniref:zinc finger protein ZAT9-like n=1 Tax=Andrographis paniculata TaxID=175694 RepID=UPI0021E91C2F|nr:zinc finger protein ZAT9-like [Andrographis paniculata]